MFRRNFERASIARREQRRFVVDATAPDRPDGVDHVSRGQSVTAGDLRIPGPATAEAAAFLQQTGSRRAMDRAVHAAPAEQRLVRGVDDRVDVERGDISDDGGEACGVQRIGGPPDGPVIRAGGRVRCARSYASALARVSSNSGTAARLAASSASRRSSPTGTRSTMPLPPTASRRQALPAARGSYAARASISTLARSAAATSAAV